MVGTIATLLLPVRANYISVQYKLYRYVSFSRGNCISYLYTRKRITFNHQKKNFSIPDGVGR